MIFDSLSDCIDGTRNFYWKDALWLSKWQIYCFPSIEQEKNIIRTGYVAQQIRDFLGMPMKSVSWLRPKAYNELIGGAKDSCHIYGMAIDFVVDNVNCDEVRRQLLPHLEMWKIRMEDKPGSSWVHIDIKEPGKGNRFFKP